MRQVLDILDLYKYLSSNTIFSVFRRYEFTLWSPELLHSALLKVGTNVSKKHVPAIYI